MRQPLNEAFPDAFVETLVPFEHDSVALSGLFEGSTSSVTSTPDNGAAASSCT